MKLDLLTDFLNIKFHKPVLWNMAVACGWAGGRKGRQTEKQTDTTKLVAAFRNFVKASKIIPDSAVGITNRCHIHFSELKPQWL
jgi:hypothetical protein